MATATENRTNGHVAIDTAENPLHRLTPEQIEEIGRELDQLHEQVMSSLDIEQRKIVELRLSERTHEETAEALGCSERTVRRMLKQVQEKLESVLQTEA